MSPACPLGLPRARKRSGCTLSDRSYKACISRGSALPPLPQVQATVVGFLASIAAVIFGWIPDGHFSIPHAFLLCASSVATAFIASLVLGKEGKGGGRGIRRAVPGVSPGPGPSISSFVETTLSPLSLPGPSPGMIMIGVIIGSRKIGINPDNVATPIAASLGDLITLALLSGISWGLYLEQGEAEASKGVTRVDTQMRLGKVVVSLQVCGHFFCVLNYLVGT